MKVLRLSLNRLVLISRSPLRLVGRSRLRGGHRRFYLHGYMREEINALRRKCGE